MCSLVLEVLLIRAMERLCLFRVRSAGCVGSRRIDLSITRPTLLLFATTKESVECTSVEPLLNTSSYRFASKNVFVNTFNASHIFKIQAFHSILFI